MLTSLCVCVHLQFYMQVWGDNIKIWNIWIFTFHIHVQRINLHIVVCIVHLLMIYSIHTKCTTYMFICVYVLPYLQYSRFKCILISRYIKVIQILNKDFFLFFLNAFLYFWLNYHQCNWLTPVLFPFQAVSCGNQCSIYDNLNHNFFISLVSIKNIVKVNEFAAVYRNQIYGLFLIALLSNTL